MARAGRSAAQDRCDTDGRYRLSGLWGWSGRRRRRDATDRVLGAGDDHRGELFEELRYLPRADRDLDGGVAERLCAKAESGDIGLSEPAEFFLPAGPRCAIGDDGSER